MAIIKSSKDTRYGSDSIVTHDGAKLPCWALTNLSSFRQKFGLDAYELVSLFQSTLVFVFTLEFSVCACTAIGELCYKLFVSMICVCVFYTQFIEIIGVCNS